MHTNEIELWLLNDEGLYRLACSVNSYRELVSELQDRGVDSIGGISIWSGDIDHGELDAAWSENFPRTGA